MSLDFYMTAKRETTVFEFNLTHNLGKMATACGLYLPMWHPERLTEVKSAIDLIPHMINGIRNLEEKSEEMKAYNPDNGWGNYDNLLSAAKQLLDACYANPDAAIRTST